MPEDLFITPYLTIPIQELDITATKSGGPGGQHVNKTSTRITVRFNVKNSSALTLEQKEKILEKLQAQLTLDGDLIIHYSDSRSQLQNKKMALQRLGEKIRAALHVPKKRRATRISATAQQSRLFQKERRSIVKKLRRIKNDDN